MYLGKALSIKISSFDIPALKKAAKDYCEQNDFQVWNDVYKKKFHLFKWMWEYEIELYKPLDYKVVKLA